MNFKDFKVEHAIIAVLVLALLYYVYTHQSLLSDLSPLMKHPKVKEIASNHGWLDSCRHKGSGESCMHGLGNCDGFGTCVTG